MQKKFSRRQFLQGCSASIAALAGARLTRVAYAAPDKQADTLVVIFLRGGWDALNVVLPLQDADRAIYEAARPTVKIPAKKILQLDDQFGLHPALSPLLDLYQEGRMGLVHAVGLDVDTRSHFDAMEYIELGTPGFKNTTSGWITRYLQTGNRHGDGIFPVASLPSQPTALLNESNTVSLNQPGDLTYWDSGMAELEKRTLQQLYSGESLLHQVGQRTLHALDAILPLVDLDYKPANGATYQEDELGIQLRTIAQLIKQGLGLQVATVDFGGWDTHEDQNYAEGGYMGDLLQSLGSGLANFYQDLDSGYTKNLSVVVISEFGRRLVQNESRGTDHGHGSVMLALGGGVNGGQVLGSWPGLSTEVLYDRADLAVTTDFRAVLSDLLTKRLGVTDLSAIFPAYPNPESLGLFRAEQG